MIPKSPRGQCAGTLRESQALCLLLSLCLFSLLIFIYNLRIKE